MNYTKQQLEAPLGEIIKEDLLLSNLGHALDFVKWRIKENKTVKSGKPDNYHYTVDVLEWDLMPYSPWQELLYFLSCLSCFIGETPRSKVHLKWKACYEGNVLRTFKTQQEANEFIQSEITRLTPAVKTSKIVSVQPE